MNTDLKNCFSCSFMRCKSGELILFESDELYLKLIGQQKCGLDIRKIFDKRYSSYIDFLFNALSPGGTVRYFRGGSSPYAVTVMRDKDKYLCTGVPLDIFMGEGMSLNAGTDNADCIYIGAAEAEHKDGSFTVTNCTERLKNYFPDLEPGADLCKILEMKSQRTFQLPDDLFLCDGVFGICLPCEVTSYRMKRIIKMTVFPLDSHRITSAFYRAETETKAEISGGICELKRNGSFIYVSDMSSGFARLAADDKIALEDICIAELFKSSDSPKMLRRQIKGGDGSLYELYALPISPNSVKAALVLFRGALAAQSLTPQELEILSLIARGNPMKYAASLTGVSGNTVRNRLKSGCEKLGIQSKEELIELYKKTRKIQ